MRVQLLRVTSMNLTHTYIDFLFPQYYAIEEGWNVKIFHADNIQFPSLNKKKVVVPVTPP